VKQILQNDGIWCEAVPNYRESLTSLINLPSSPPHVVNNRPKFPFDVVLLDVSSPCGGVCLLSLSTVSFSHYKTKKKIIYELIVILGYDGYTMYRRDQNIGEKELLRYSCANYWCHC
jgi:hypothetical protein